MVSLIIWQYYLKKKDLMSYSSNSIFSSFLNYFILFLNKNVILGETSNLTKIFIKFTSKVNNINVRIFITTDIPSDTYLKGGKNLQNIGEIT